MITMFISSELVRVRIGINDEGLCELGNGKDANSFEKPGTFCVEVSAMGVRTSLCPSAFCHDTVKGTENDNDVEPG